jgi:prepilin-type N-terminal cleavage/methylation domain-containing protein
MGRPPSARGGIQPIRPIGVTRRAGRRTQDSSACGRRGLTIIEVIVVLAIIVAASLVLLMMLPRARERARLTSCTFNLSQVGKAIALYDQTFNHLPSVGGLASLDDLSDARPTGLLRTLMVALQLADFTGLKDARTPPEVQPGLVPGELPVSGFVCPSDPNALAGRFAAPVSYRATTGDSPAEGNGAFGAGRSLSLAVVEAGDGASYTAAFSERLAGDNQPRHPALFNYQVAPGMLSAVGCPDGGDPARWRGDAGSSWRWADYRSTLYHHALLPNAKNSCIALDGQSALIGASSGHVDGVNLLKLDGSVSLVKPTVNPKVWKELAKLGASNDLE